MSDHGLRLLEREAATGDLVARKRLFRHRERAGDLRSEHYAEMVRISGTLEKLNLWSLGTNYGTKRLRLHAVRVGRVNAKAPWRVLILSCAKNKKSRKHRSSCNLDGSGVVGYGFVKALPKYLEQGYDIEAEEVALEIENAQEQKNLILGALASRLQGPRSPTKLLQGWMHRPVTFPGKMLKASEWCDGWDAGDELVDWPFHWTRAELPLDYKPRKSSKFAPGLRVVP